MGLGSGRAGTAEAGLGAPATGGATRSGGGCPRFRGATSGSARAARACAVAPAHVGGAAGGAPEAAQQRPSSSVVMADTWEWKARCMSSRDSSLATDHTLRWNSAGSEGCQSLSFGRRPHPASRGAGQGMVHRQHKQERTRGPAQPWETRAPIVVSGSCLCQLPAAACMRLLLSGPQAHRMPPLRWPVHTRRLESSKCMQQTSGPCIKSRVGATRQQPRHRPPWL